MAIEKITFQSFDGKKHHTEVSGFPDKCPACRQGMQPVFYAAYQVKDDIIRSNIVLVFQCPLKQCRGVFQGYYTSTNNFGEYFILNKSYLPFVFEAPSVPDSVKDISPRFVKAYAHSYFAEKNNLSEVCGCGYRRALELLIKDYLIKGYAGDEAKAEEIKRKPLGQCIEQDITDEKIKSVAKRAAWLGNDATHYVRKWEDHDIESLKTLIKLVTIWIDAAETTKAFEESMPE